MSLKQSSKKNEKDLIPIGISNDNYIYFDTNKNGEQDINANDIIPIPFLNKKANGRISLMISAVSGSGKSVLCGKIVDKLNDLYKYKMVVLFTQASSIDPAFEELNERSKKNIEKNKKPTFIHVCLNNDPYLFQLTTESLSDSIVIFDDYENCEPQTMKFVLGFIKDLLERSRKQNTAVLIINHMAQQGHRTKPIIFEANSYIVFPSTNRNAVKKFLTAYGDLNKQEIEDMIEKSSTMFDFLYLSKSYPRYWMNKSEVHLLK